MIWIFISSDRYEVRMDIKSFDPLWTNQTVETSKHVFYCVAGFEPSILVHKLVLQLRATI